MEHPAKHGNSNDKASAKWEKAIKNRKKAKSGKILMEIPGEKSL